MARQTTLHKYNVPTEGDTDYEDTFDRFFTDLDEDIEIRDVASNINNYDPVEDAKFVATDTGAVYQGDGSSWVLVDRKFDQVTANGATIDNTLTADAADITNAITGGSADITNTVSAADADITNGVTASTATIASLVDSDDSNAWETLHRLGYDDGDFVPMITSVQGNTADGTTNDTYTRIHDQYLTTNMTPSTMFPNGEFSVVCTGNTNDGGDQMDLRFRATGTDEVIAEFIDIADGTWDYRTQGPSNMFTPSEPNSEYHIVMELRNSDNSTDVSYHSPTLTFGLIL